MASNTLPAAEFAACKIPGTKLIIYEEGRASFSWRLIGGGSQRSSQLSRRCSVYWLMIHDPYGGIDTLDSISRLEPPLGRYQVVLPSAGARRLGLACTSLRRTMWSGYYSGGKFGPVSRQSRGDHAAGHGLAR